MISFKQKLINIFYRHVLRPLALFDGRSQFKRMLVSHGGYFLASRPKSMRFAKSTIATSKGEVDLHYCTYGEVKTNLKIFYIHGGGFGTGGAKSHQHIAARLAGLAQGTAIIPIYPLAPENPFPVAIEQIYATYLALLDTGVVPKDIILAGDSAGGNLSMALILMLENSKQPLPAGIILFSPSLDLTHQNPIFIQNARTEKILSPKLSKNVRRSYLGDQDPSNPLASPLFGTYINPPPILIFASADEMLYGDASDFTKKLKAQGRDVTLITENNLPHVWQFSWGKSIEADRSLPQCEEFLKRFS